MPVERHFGEVVEQRSKPRQEIRLGQHVSAHHVVQLLQDGQRHVVRVAPAAMDEKRIPVGTEAHSGMALASVPYGIGSANVVGRCTLLRSSTWILASTSPFSTMPPET